MDEASFSPRMRSHFHQVDQALAASGMEALERAGVLRDLETHVAELRAEQGLDDDAILARLDPPEAYGPLGEPRPEAAEPPKRIVRVLGLPIQLPPNPPEDNCTVVGHWCWILLVAFVGFLALRGFLSDWTLRADGIGGPALSYGRSYGWHRDMEDLGAALQRYVARNGGRFPRELAELARYGPREDNRLLSLSKQSDIPVLEDGFPVGRPTLLYPGAEAASLAPNAYVAVWPYRYEKTLGHIVLFRDGHVADYSYRPMLREAIPAGAGAGRRP